MVFGVLPALTCWLLTFVGSGGPPRFAGKPDEPCQAKKVGVLEEAQQGDWMARAQLCVGAQKTPMNIRILQTAFSGIPLVLGLRTSM